MLSDKNVPKGCFENLLLLLYPSEQEYENLPLYHALQECDFPTGISRNLKLTENIRKDKSLYVYELSFLKD